MASAGAGFSILTKVVFSRKWTSVIFEGKSGYSRGSWWEKMGIQPQYFAVGTVAIPIPKSRLVYQPVLTSCFFTSRRLIQQFL